MPTIVRNHFLQIVLVCAAILALAPVYNGSLSWGLPTAIGYFSILGVRLLLLVTLAMLCLLYLKKHRSSIVLLLTALQLTFVGLEIFFQFVPESHGVSYALAARNWFAYYWWPHNSLGYRDQEPHSAPLRKEVLVVGDSLVAGHGIKNIQDRFTEQLGTRLGSPYRVHNLGKNNSSTIDYAERLKTFPVKPDWVVWSYYPNDIEGVATRYQHQFTGFHPYSELGVWQEFVRRSFFLNFVFWRFPHAPLANYEEFLQKSYADPRVLEAHRQERDLLLSQIQSIGAKTVVVFFPMFQCPNIGEIETRAWQRDLASKQILQLNARDLIADIPLSAQTVSPRDVHPSPMVHARVGNRLSEIILEADSSLLPLEGRQAGTERRTPIF